MEQDFQDLADDYYANVARYVFTEAKSISPNADAEIQKVAQNPDSCGYHIISTYAPMAGAVYAMVFYALTKKVARQEDCEMLNQIQQYMMVCISQKLYEKYQQ